MKEKSYTELMNAARAKRKKSKEEFVLDLYIDMLLYEAKLLRKKEILITQIDEAIDQGDVSRFKDLAKNYIELTKQFGT